MLGFAKVCTATEGGQRIGAALLDVHYVWCFVFMYSGLAAVMAANGVVYLRMQNAAVVVPRDNEIAAQVQ